MLIELYIDSDQRKCLLFISLRPLGHQDKRSSRCCCYENISSNSARDLCWHYWQVVTWLARVYLVFSSMKARRKHLLCRAAGFLGKGVGNIHCYHVNFWTVLSTPPRIFQCVGGYIVLKSILVLCTPYVLENAWGVDSTKMTHGQKLTW